MRKTLMLFTMVLMASVTAGAQENSTATLFGGYSYVRASNNGVSDLNANGAIVSASYNLTDRIGIVGEFDFDHIGGQANQLISSSISGLAPINANFETYLFGPKFSIFGNNKKFAPFVQALVGGIHADNSYAFDETFTTGTQTRLAFAGGGGLDWNFGQHWGIRLAQVDYLYTRLQTSADNHQNNIRYSAGVTFRF